MKSEKVKGTSENYSICLPNNIYCIGISAEAESLSDEKKRLYENIFLAGVVAEI
jgi:hypothetical protein